MVEGPASALDKTDWRATIHRKLEDCVNAEGTPHYPSSVKSLISAFSTLYPGWNAKQTVNSKIKELETHYSNIWDNWIESNHTKRRWQKYKYKRSLYTRLHKDIFEFIKDLCGGRRMLLWGVRHTPGGEPIGD